MWNKRMEGQQSVPGGLQEKGRRWKSTSNPEVTGEAGDEAGGLRVLYCGSGVVRDT